MGSSITHFPRRMELKIRIFAKKNLCDIAKKEVQFFLQSKCFFFVFIQISFQYAAKYLEY